MVVFQYFFTSVHVLTQPCPCGNFFENGKCTCTSYEVDKYMKKLSGPILDRIDLIIEMKKLSEDELVLENRSESSKDIKLRVEKAREIQKNRYKSSKTNSKINENEIKKYCKITDENKKFLIMALKNLDISARGYDKILKIARTIADLDGKEDIEKKHLLEAISFRRK